MTASEQLEELTRSKAKALSMMVTEDVYDLEIIRKRIDWAIQFMVDFQEKMLDIATAEFMRILDQQEDISQLDKLWKGKEW